MNTLITIPFSHYNEKARWALDFFGLSYREMRVLPGFHMPVTALATLRNADNKADRVSSPYSAPVLITASGQKICDSTRIMRWASDSSASSWKKPFMSPTALSFESRFSDALGAHTRRIAYSWIIDQNVVMNELFKRNSSSIQSAAYRLVWPRIRESMRTSFCLTPSAINDSLQRIRSEFAYADECLKGKNYFSSAFFTAADLTWACMAAPVLWVSREEGFAASFPARKNLGEAANRLIDELRITRSGIHALKMFRLHRSFNNSR